MRPQRVVEIALASDADMLQRPRYIHHAVGCHIHAQRAADAPEEDEIMRQLAAAIFVGRIRRTEINAFDRSILRHAQARCASTLARSIIF